MTQKKQPPPPRSNVADLFALAYEREEEKRRARLLAAQSASESPPVATSGKLEPAASIVATSLTTPAASEGPLLVPRVASNRPTKKTFTPKGKAQFNVRIPKTLKAKLDMLAAAEGKGMNELAEQAFALLLATPDARLLAAYESDDELNDPIIRLYAKYTGRPFTEKDREAYRKVKHLDVNIVRLGILETLLNTDQKQINSFAYFLPEIEQAIQKVQAWNTPTEYIDYVASKVRKRYGK